MAKPDAPGTLYIRFAVARSFTYFCWNSFSGVAGSGSRLAQKIFPELEPVRLIFALLERALLVGEDERTHVVQESLVVVVEFLGSCGRRHQQEKPRNDGHGGGTVRIATPPRIGSLGVGGAEELRSRVDPGGYTPSTGCDIGRLATGRFR